MQCSSDHAEEANSISYCTCNNTETQLRLRQVPCAGGKAGNRLARASQGPGHAAPPRRATSRPASAGPPLWCTLHKQHRLSKAISPSAQPHDTPHAYTPALVNSAQHAERAQLTGQCACAPRAGAPVCAGAAAPARSAAPASPPRVTQRLARHRQPAGNMGCGPQPGPQAGMGAGLGRQRGGWPWRAAASCRRSASTSAASFTFSAASASLSCSSAAMRAACSSCRTTAWRHPRASFALVQDRQLLFNTEVKSSCKQQTQWGAAIAAAPRLHPATA